MRLHSTRYSIVSILIHWLLAAASVALLGLGWYLHASPTTTRLHNQLVSLHVSLGLSTAILVAVALFSRLLFRAPAYPKGFGPLQRYVSGATHVFLYLSLIALVASGYLHEIFSETPMEFWGAPLPAWGESDEKLAQSLMQAHAVAAYVFAGFVVFHILLVVANSVRQPGFGRRMLLVKDLGEEETPLMAAQQPAGLRIVQKLAARLRLLGWLQFWLQFVLAFLCGLLLQFATSGRIFSSLRLGFGEAMHWGGVALALLCLTCALGFGYTRIARKLELSPETYIAASNSGFWRVSGGLLLSLIGESLAFIGVALSIVLLVGKTVSQPPGIAITDPSKIIRALDVFVLLMNYLLLLAHALGLACGSWLAFETRRARNACNKLRAEAPAAQETAVPAPAAQEASI
jgi:cytochrome b561